MDKLQNYSTAMSLFISLLTLAYVFGNLSATIADLEEDKLNIEEVVDVCHKITDKERKLSDAIYYKRPEVDVRFMNREQLQIRLEYLEDYISAMNKRIIVVEAN